MAGIESRIQIDGVDDLIHRLSRALAVETRAAPMLRLVERLRTRLEKYPPPPADSTYIRTGDLGRGWAVGGAVQADASGTNQFADRVSVDLNNTVSYAPWVQDAERQAAMHQGRWPTTQDAVDAETGPFLRDLTDSMNGALNSR